MSQGQPKVPSLDPSYASLYVPHDMNVTIKFKERNYMVEMDVQLHRYDYLPDIVQNLLINKHHLPLYLERTALDLLRECVQDEVKRKNQETIDIYFGDDNDYDPENDDLNVDVKLPTREEEDDFGSIYHKVFHSSPKAQLHLLKIEQQMNIMYRAAMNTRETEIEELRGVQAKEMDTICDVNLQGDTHETPNENDLYQVVHLHMAQIKELESKHIKHLIELKSQFKKQFKKFVYDLYDDLVDAEGLVVNQDIDEDMLKLELGTFTDGLELLYKKEEHDEKLTPRHTRFSSLLGFINKVNVPTLRRSNSVPMTETPVQNISIDHVVSPAAAYTPFHTSKHTIFRVTMPRLTIHVVYNTAHVLTKRENENMSLDDELIVRASAMEGLVGDRCSALVSNCYPCIGESGTEYFEFTSRDYSKIALDAMQTCAPELHFDDLDDQVERIAKAFPETPGIGDYFVTKHSNLSRVHLIYHLITQEARLTTSMTEFGGSAPSSPTPKSFEYEALMKGFDSIVHSLDECCTRDLSLILPFAVTHRHPRVKEFRKLKVPVYSGDELLFQLEDILKKLKAMRNPLENIYLFLPAGPKHSSGHFSKQLENLIKSMFENPNDTDDLTEVIMLSHVE